MKIVTNVDECLSAIGELTLNEVRNTIPEKERKEHLVEDLERSKEIIKKLSDLHCGRVVGILLMALMFLLQENSTVYRIKEMVENG